MTPSITTRPPARPRGLLKLLYDAPRALYRLRLGWLLGHRFLLLTHRGRKSGRARQTMLEVVRYDPQTRESAVISAYGDRSDWYRNILATPAIELRTGGRRYVPQYRPLAAEEAYAVLADYRRRYGPLLKRLLRYMGYTYTGRDDELRAIAERVRAIGFRPAATSRSAPTVAPTDASTVPGGGGTG